VTLLDHHNNNTAQTTGNNIHLAISQHWIIKATTYSYCTCNFVQWECYKYKQHSSVTINSAANCRYISPITNPHITQPKGSTSFISKLTGHDPDSVSHNFHLTNHFSKIHLNVILPFSSQSSKWLFFKNSV
jgi:hypothetical protein